MVFVLVRCADSIEWLARLIGVPGDFLEAHPISDLWLYVAIMLTAAEAILRTRRAR